MATHNVGTAYGQHIDEIEEYLKKHIKYANDDDDDDDETTADDAAYAYINEYTEKYKNDECSIALLSNALRRLNIYHILGHYMLSILCMEGNKMAIHHLGLLYEGIDGDANTELGVGVDVMTAIALFNSSGIYQSCLEIIFMCTERNTYFSKKYPKERIDSMIKTNLIKAFKLYDKPIHGPTYQSDIGYIFDIVPFGIIKSIEKENPDFSKFY